MDPQAAWNEMLDFISNRDFEQAELRADALLSWSSRHGFPPQTLTRVLPEEWDGMICRYVCQKVMNATQVQ
jgi:hypothetical protein